jgi:hypothetical protein
MYSVSAFTVNDTGAWRYLPATMASILRFQHSSAREAAVPALSRRSLVGALAFLSVGLSSTVRAQFTHDKPRAIVFRGVRIFDGTSAALSESTNVRVKGNRMEKISADPALAAPSSDVLTIDRT